MSDGNNTGGNNNHPANDSNDKFEDQINLILAAFGDEVEIDPPDWRTAGVNAIYRAGSVLVRDHDAPRTLDLFGGGRAGAQPPRRDPARPACPPYPPTRRTATD